MNITPDNIGPHMAEARKKATAQVSQALNYRYANRDQYARGIVG